MSFFELLPLRTQFIEVCFDFDLLQRLIFLDKNSKTITQKLLTRMFLGQDLLNVDFFQTFFFT